MLNSKHVRLEEGISTAVPECVRRSQAVGKESECEISFVRGGRVRFARNSCYRRVQLVAWSHPCVERTAGDRIMCRWLLVIRPAGRILFLTAAVHIGHCARLRLLS